MPNWEAIFNKHAQTASGLFASSTDRMNSSVRSKLRRDTSSAQFFDEPVVAGQQYRQQLNYYNITPSTRISNQNVP
jgi:hypothetical protein